MIKKTLYLILSVIQVIIGGILIFFLPFFILYSWSRYLLKKIFKLKPEIIYSPLSAPLPLLAMRAIRTQGYEADNIALVGITYFKSLNFEFVLGEKKYLNYLVKLTDYLGIFYWAILKYDIFEFPFTGGLLMYSHFKKWEYRLLKLCAKKISVYGYGSDCKILSEVKKEADKIGLKYHTAMDRNETTEIHSEEFIMDNLNRGKKYADVIIAGADLVHLGPKSIMLPVPIDINLWKYIKPNNNKIITLFHSTNHRSHKGTRFIINSYEKLKNILPIKLLLVEGKGIEYCRKIYPKGDIFIPDVITGWHGFTLIEAMATGRPVITYMRKDFLKRHWYYAQHNPVISANPDTLNKAIMKLVKDKKLREDLGKKGREYVERFHTFEFGGKARAIIYDHIWRNKPINQRIFEKALKKENLI